MAARAGATELAGEARLAGRYAYVRELGRGASGRVVLASDVREGGAARALKVVSAADAARLGWELETLHRLAHPNVARVYELIRLDARLGGAFRLERGSVVLVEDYVEGEPVDRIAERSSPDARVAFALAVGTAAARGLAAIHALGLVHGDVKPSNIVATERGDDARVIDLGLARPPGAAQSVSGTPSYLAPEAWQGERTLATDLWALGATLHHLLGGRSPHGETGSQSVASVVAECMQSPRSASTLPELVPAALRRLVAMLLEPDPSLRPSSAREVAARLAAIASDLGYGDATGGGIEDAPTRAERAMAVSVLPLVGRDAELAALIAALDRGGVVAVVGPPGAGKMRLVRDGILSVQRSRALGGAKVPTCVRGTLEIASEAAPDDAIVVIEEADSITLADALAAVEAARVAGGTATIVLGRTQALRELPDADASAADILVGPLGRAGIEVLLASALEGARPTAALVDAAFRASGGLPGRLCRLLADAALAGRDPQRPETLAELGASDTAGNLHVPSSARDAAVLLAVAGGALRATEPSLVEHASALVAAGLATIDADGSLRLRADVARSIRASLGERGRRSAARRIDAASLPSAGLAFVHAALGDTAAAGRAFLDAIADRRASGDPEAAAQLAVEAIELLGPAPRLVVARADALRALGRYADAIDALDGTTGAETELLRAEVHRLRGARDDAAAAAARVLDGDAAAGDVVRAHAILARLALDRGDISAATDHLQGAAPAGTARPELAGEGAASPAIDDATRARWSEVAALVALYRGEIEKAGAHASTAIEAARRALDRAAEARALGIQALLAQQRGEIRAAARRYARAFELADAAGESHAAATFLVNVGLARLDAGEPGPAIASLREGARRLARLRRDQDLARALYNLGLAAILVGDDDLGGSAVRHAREASQRCGDTAAAAYATILQAEMALRAGTLGKAREIAKSATDGAASAPARVRAVVWARCATILGSLGDRDRAEEAAARASEAATADGGDTALVEAAVARARVAIATGQKESALEAAEAARAHAERAGTYEGRLRALLASADAAELARDADRARVWLGEVRTLLDTAESTLSASARARLRDVPAYRKALASLPHAEPETTEHDGRWRRLVRIAGKLTAERRVGRLYEDIVDAAVELSGAERGFLILRDEDGGLRVRTARGLGTRALSDADAEFSRSIAARAIDAGQLISTVDALRDERMDGVASVHALSLRSVVAVPLRRRGEIRGAIYLEDRLRPSAFTSADVALVADLAEIASLALDGADALRAERRHARRLAALRRRLARTVESQAIEIASLRRAQPGASGEIEGIVAQSPAMRRALDLVLRVAQADVPVLVTGESGTGKELVARAIHARSARARAPFVSENCGAIPEPLLESALFGHVRGAFTGAERTRVGLFEAADGGTLLLDEVGEMSPAMQAKLLRVAQDGETRPVGSERSRRVDVRIVAATHRDLEEMVRRGTFREDLYYRLAVVTIPIPPLRERPEDIPPLVAAFVARHAPDRDVRFDRGAMARLASYSWPGNVRQLENEVQRALVLGSDLVREEDLSPAVRGDDASAPDELDLKGQIASLERRMIRRALDASGDNQTRAAKLLGVSRYGLQKMMKRLGLS